MILLSLIPRHCRDLLGLNVNTLPSDEWDNDPPSTKDVEQAAGFLKNHPNRLKLVKLKVLKALCFEQGITLPHLTHGQHTKKDYIFALLVRIFVHYAILI